MARLKLPKKKVMEVPVGAWKRFLAFAIDLLVINIIVIAPLKKYFRSLVPSTKYRETVNFVISNPDVAQTLTVITIMISILVVLYFTLLEFRTRTTLGKYFLRLYVKNKDMGFWKLLVSNLTFIPALPFIILWVVDPIHMFFSEKKQRLMERIVNIQTVEEIGV